MRSSSLPHIAKNRCRTRKIVKLTPLERNSKRGQLCDFALADRSFGKLLSNLLEHRLGPLWSICLDFDISCFRSLREGSSCTFSGAGPQQEGANAQPVRRGGDLKQDWDLNPKPYYES